MTATLEENEMGKEAKQRQNNTKLKDETFAILLELLNAAMPEFKGTETVCFMSQ